MFLRGEEERGKGKGNNCFPCIIIFFCISSFYVLSNVRRGDWKKKYEKEGGVEKGLQGLRGGRKGDSPSTAAVLKSSIPENICHVEWKEEKRRKEKAEGIKPGKGERKKKGGESGSDTDADIFAFQF